ncbi:MAG: hypothetical protein JWQ02_1088 [Capsulimonas sp.]|nr:hypothetical protein [Capsulimonas sp.]
MNCHITIRKYHILQIDEVCYRTYNQSSSLRAYWTKFYH